MELKVFVTVFISVFIAELGDKTQLATMLFAADKEVSKWTVFCGASVALVVASAIGVLAGALLSEFINPKYLSYLAGTGFIVIGVVTMIRAENFPSAAPLRRALIRFTPSPFFSFVLRVLKWLAWR